MIYSVKWTRRALSRLQLIGNFISERNPAAANRIVGKIYDDAQSLADHPLKGRTGRVPGTRELVQRNLPYVIVYRNTSDRIEVLTVMHASQKWPKEF